MKMERETQDVIQCHSLTGRQRYGEHTPHLEVLLKHGQFELLSALRIIRIHHDPLAHHIPRKDTNAVLALSANWLPVLEELLSQLVHLKEGESSETKGNQQEEE